MDADAAKPETPADAQLEEVDKYRLQLLMEREKRLAAEEQMHAAALQRVHDEKARCQLMNQGFRAQLMQKYGIKPNDAIDIDTGTIRRQVGKPPQAPVKIEIVKPATEAKEAEPAVEPKSPEDAPAPAEVKASA